MKIISIIILILVILVGLVYFITFPTVPKLSDCLKQGSQLSVILSQRATNEHWDKTLRCLNGKETVIKLSLCYEKVGENSLVPVSFIESIAHIINPRAVSLKQMIETHNNICKDIPNAIF